VCSKLHCVHVPSGRHDWRPLTGGHFFHGAVPFAFAGTAWGGVPADSYFLITLVSSLVSLRLVRATVRFRGMLCSSTDSCGAMTPRAWQMGETSPFANFTASGFGFDRFSRAHNRRPLCSPSTISKVSCRYSPSPFLVGFTSLS